MEENSDKVACEKRVYRVITQSPIVQLLIQALEKNNCPFIPHRHLACESCSQMVNGGFDVENNQVVICYNRCKSKAKVEKILKHELIHMYDHCTAKIDFKNLHHLACTEIRAANLVHCKLKLCDEDPILMSRKNCVKTVAARSVSVIQGMDKKDSLKLINRVFDKCYADREPIGRYTYDLDSEKCAQHDLNPMK